MKSPLDLVPMWASEILDEVKKDIESDPLSGKILRDEKEMCEYIRRRIHSSLIKQSEMRGVPLRLEEMAELAWAAARASGVELLPAKPRAGSHGRKGARGWVRDFSVTCAAPPGWTDRVDRILMNRACQRCGSLLTPGSLEDHTAEACDDSLASSVMRT